jgi:hypothetical protein
MPMPRRKITPRERAFCNAYLQCLDGPTAIINAGFKVADPTEAASRMLRRGPVRRYLDRVLAKRIAGPEELMGELSEVATAPWRDFLTIIRDKDGNEVDVKVNLKDKLSAIKTLLQAQGKLRDPLTIKVEAVLSRELDRLESPESGQRAGLRVLDSPALSLPPAPSDPLLSADTIDAEMVEREGGKGVKAPETGEAGKTPSP